MEPPPSPLDDLVAQLQRRYGARAACRGDALPAAGPPPVLPTGHPALDAALPSGGLPRGRVTEVIGPRSAGATTLALTTVAQAQRRAGDLACLVDLSGTFDPPSAHALGVDLNALAVLRPQDGAVARLAVHTLLARQAVGVLVVDSLPRWLALPRGPESLRALLRPLRRLLQPTGCALLVLNPLPTGLLPDPAVAPAATLAALAALRLRLAPTGWLRRGPAIAGVRTRVSVLTPPFADPRATVVLDLPLAHPEARV
ncbi:MAG: hypothetical protein HGA45_30940 [Chloroflexales bacterium]|nr:hypothetical protein [Chloroflexales bacterium]